VFTFTKPIVSVVLGSYNHYSFLRAVLESVRNNGQNFPYEIIVVDGGSTDGSLHYLTKQKDIITIIQHNRGKFRGKKIERRSWGYFMNLGFKTAQGIYILMISEDCLLVPGALKNGVSLFDELLSSG
jgi:glycosyltransferase involved in cell wall biosynthesis